MTDTQPATATRRTVLSMLGAGLTSIVGAQTVSGQTGDDAMQYAIQQGETCTAVRPFEGSVPVTELYEYQLPEKYISEENGAVTGSDAPYASAGTQDLQRAHTSIAFLYRGPNGVSLVVVHGKVGADDAGSVTFRITGLPDEGQWIVKDDLYYNPETGRIADTNYDRWHLDGTEHRIDWTWGSAGTDGGVFRGLDDEFTITIDPAFNEAAALYNEYYEGTVTDWQFLTATADGEIERVSLALETPLEITTDGCATSTPSTPTDTAPEQQTQTQEQDVTIDQSQSGSGTGTQRQEQDVHIEQSQNVARDQAQEIKAEACADAKEAVEDIDVVSEDDIDSMIDCG